MAQWFAELAPAHTQFVRAQKMFFISTAPPDGAGYPNLSPKGYDSLDVLGPKELVYVDWPGSGNQTASHVNAGGRVTLLFTSFESQALILRIYGSGRTLARDSAAYLETVSRMREGLVGEYTRQLIAIDVDKVQTSCGYAVPRYAYEGDRDTLSRYWERKAAAGEFEASLAKSVQRQEPV